MSNWKERIFSSVALCAIFTGISIIYSMHMTVRAQEPVMIEDDGEHGLLVDEALDNVEKDFDVLPQEGDPAAETFVPELPVADEGTETPAGQEIPQQVVEIEAIELNTEIPMNLETADEAAGSEATDDVQGDLEEDLETRMVPLFHAEAAGLIEILTGMKSERGEVTYNEDARALVLKDIPERIEVMASLIKEADIPLETEIFELESSYDPNILDKIKGILTPNVGQVHVDEGAHSIVVADTPSKIAEVTELMAALYSLNKEVVLDAHVLQIVLNDEHLDGIDWEAIVSEYKELAFPGFDAKPDGKLDFGTLSREDYDILLEALDTVGVVRPVLDNKIVAISGTQQAIDIPLSALKDLGDGNKASDISLDRGDMESLGGPAERKVRLSVVPTIKKDRPLSVLIEPQLLQGLPEKDGTSQRTTFDLQEGSIIVIGGLFKDIAVSSAWKIPLLGDLPFLGFVFRSEGENLRKTEVITFLTAQTMEKKETREE